MHNNLLFGVAAISKDNAWDVGANYTGFEGPPVQALIEHWNGSQWSVVSSPNPGITQTNAGGLAVISKNNIWAVGSYDTSGGGFKILALHWNGSQWRVVQTPTIGSGGHYFQYIAADSINDIWVVGAYIDTGKVQQLTLIEHCC